MKPGRLIGALLLCGVSAGSGHAAATKVIGFYAPWDSASLASLQQHSEDLLAVVPAWISVTGPDHKVTIAPDPTGRAALAALRKPPRLWLMVQNALLGTWDGPGAATLLHDKAATAMVLDQLETEGLSDKASGLVVDFEDLPPGAQPDLLMFLASARERCRRHGWTLAVAAPVTDPDWNLSALAKVTDRVVLMAYDEHWPAGTPGPIASTPWFSSVVRRAVSQLPPAEAIVALASYAYDWSMEGPATILAIPEAETLAARNGVRPEREPASGSEHFTYTAGGVAHMVWMSDAVAVRSQMEIARTVGVRNVGLWRLGTEDPAIWSSQDAASGPAQH